MDAIDFYAVGEVLNRVQNCDYKRLQTLYQLCLKWH